MPVLFAGSKSPFLSTLGIPYGILAIEGCEQITVITQQETRALLVDCATEMFITSDQAQVLDEQAVALKILPDLRAVFEQVRQFSLPKDHRPEFHFVTCTDCGFPIAHGNVHNADMEPVVPVMNLITGFTMCESVARKHQHINPIDCIAIFQGMLRADLPMDNDEFKQRMDALPADLRKIADEKVAAGVRQKVQNMLSSLGISGDAINVLDVE